MKAAENPHCASDQPAPTPAADAKLCIPLAVLKTEGLQKSDVQTCMPALESAALQLELLATHDMIW